MSATRRKWIGGLLGVSWAVRSPGAATSTLAGAGATSVGGTLPLGDLPLIERGTFRAADAEGLVTVVYWWASWCPFCAEMSPSIEKLWRTQRERGLTVLGVSIDKTLEPAREYRRRKGYTFPSTWQGFDIGGVLPRAAKVPMVVVRNRAGRVVVAETGQLFPEDVEQIARFL